MRNYGDGRYVDLVTQTGTIAELRNKNTDDGFAELLTVFVTPNEGDEQRIFFVLGAETSDDIPPTLGSVSYAGDADFRFDTETGFDGEPNSTVNVGSELTLIADFMDGNISGVGADFPDESIENYAGTLQLEEASFTQNAFTGNIVPDAEFLADAGEGIGLFDRVTGRFSGAFYGDEAQEVGGVLTVSGGSLDGVNYNDVGGFVAEVE